MNHPPPLLAYCQIHIKVAMRPVVIGIDFGDLVQEPVDMIAAVDMKAGVDDVLPLVAVPVPGHPYSTL